MKGQHLISVDELRAAGALEVPPSWRKSLGDAPDKNIALLPGFDDDEQTELDSGVSAIEDTTEDIRDSLTNPGVKKVSGLNGT